MVLLHPTGGAGARAWFEHVVRYARRLAPSAGARAVVADGPAGVLGLAGCVAELEGLSRLGPRANEEVPVLSARQYALDRLLAQVVERRELRAFVAEQVGRLIEWDREHHGDLLVVLEAALDFPRHEQAAHRCFMHRNTFRHRLRHATEVLGRDLDDPDVRLATHVALKLRKAVEPDGPEGRPAPAPPQRPRRPAKRARARTRR
jgi:purine catabolism regulator